MNKEEAVEIFKRTGLTRKQFLEAAKLLETNKLGVDCPHCGTFNTHEECGTYLVMFPECYHCGECTEVP